MGWWFPRRREEQALGPAGPSEQLLEPVVWLLEGLEEEHLAFLGNLLSSWADRIRIFWASSPVSSGTSH